MFKKLLTLKIGAILLGICMFFVIIIAIISAITGTAIGYENLKRQVNENQGSIAVVNNNLYAERYRSLLNKNLLNKGYVSLERLVFYLQRTHNILDITELSDDEWNKAYIENLNLEKKQMIPIKTICKKINNDSSLPFFNIESNTNANGVFIEVLNLCETNGEDITFSNNYSEDYPYLPFVFPLKDNFTITSIVFEVRNVDLNLSKDEQDRVNYHSGWDFATPLETPFYNMCEGTIKNIVNSQFNDLPFNQSNNKVGNYVVVSCNNGFEINYHHIKANSVPSMYKIGTPIKEGVLLGKVSTTGLSTGSHLHVGLTINGKKADVLEYVDFNYKK